MGFAPERVEWALYATGNKGLQPALDHLEANQDKDMPADYKSQPAAAGSSTQHEVSAAPSYKGRASQYPCSPALPPVRRRG